MSLPIITIIISIVGGAFFYKIKRTLWNPASVFLFEWALVIYLASLQLYNLIDISTEAYAFVLIGVIPPSPEVDIRRISHHENPPDNNLIINNIRNKLNTIITIDAIFIRE